MTDDSRSKIFRETDPVLWTEEFALGVSEVDGQHQVLFERVNAFFAAARSAEPRPGLEEALASLETYATYHFAEEEKYMECIGYPGRDQHAAAHRVLMRQLLGLTNLLPAQGKSVGVVATSAALLRGWLLDHIVDEDGAVGAYARSVARPPP